MAADYYLSSRYQEMPILRFYQWKPYALSIGYHQSVHPFDLAKCLHSNIDLVVRPTGGRAILHSEELTYAVIIPRESEFAQEGVQQLHKRISCAIARGVRTLGLDIYLNDQETNLRNRYAGSSQSTACFSTVSKHELQIDGRKIVGSAQRKMEKNILQHGSILLDDYHLNIVKYMKSDTLGDHSLNAALQKSTTCLNAHLRNRGSVEELVFRIVEGFKQEFGCEFAQSSLTSYELMNIHTLKDHFIPKEIHENTL